MHLLLYTFSQFLQEISWVNSLALEIMVISHSSTLLMLVFEDYFSFHIIIIQTFYGS